MNERTGKVEPYEEIPEDRRKEYSEPFKANEIVEVKGLKFRITRWSQGRLFLKLVKKGAEAPGQKWVNPPGTAPTGGATQRGNESI